MGESRFAVFFLDVMSRSRCDFVDGGECVGILMKWWIFVSVKQRYGFVEKEKEQAEALRVEIYKENILCDNVN